MILFQVVTAKTGCRCCKQGVIEAGGIPFEFNTIAVCDGMLQGHIGMRYSFPAGIL